MCCFHAAIGGLNYRQNYLQDEQNVADLSVFNCVSPKQDLVIESDCVITLPSSGGTMVKIRYKAELRATGQAQDT